VQEVPTGLIAKRDGSFGVDLMEGGSSARVSRLLEVSGAGFPNNESTAPAKLATDEPSEREDPDQALALDGEYTANYRANVYEGLSEFNSLSAFAAGSAIAELTDGDYAARYGHRSAEGDRQASEPPWNGGPLEFWTQAAEGGVPNMGIRIFNSQGTIVTTLGGRTKGEACNIASAQMAIATGANNTVFAITDPNEEEGNYADEVIEFAPSAEGGSSKPCPEPKGEVEVEAEGKRGFARSVMAQQREEVKFSALGIDREGETPFSYEWTFGEKSEGFKLTSKIEETKVEGNPEFFWPDPEAEHKYERAGTYEAKVKLTGDYGTSEFPMTVNVAPSEPASAAFTAPASVVAEKEVVFDASASKPTPGSTIVDYHWEFGDGTAPVNGGTAEQKHKFAKAGEYEVKLTITDEQGESATATPQKVVVAPAPESGGGGTTSGGGSTGGGSSGGGSTSGGSTSTVSPPPILPPPVSTVAPKPLTKAQKLANALKTCHKSKSKKKRASCEKQARHEFAPKPKPKKKSKKK
jgi:PKD repeat protein